MNLNKAIIVGNVTQQPEIRSIATGTQVANFSVATNRFYNDRATGERQQETEFHRVVAWSRLAEIIGQYVQKGSLIMIEGRIQTRSWDDKTTGAKRYATEIIADSIQLGPRREGATGGAPSQYADRTQPSPRTQRSAPSQDEPPMPTIDAGAVTEDDIDLKDIPF
ncbi:MAG: single-stranded DNA-binding protein [Candidatus Spechtbacteria bacterium SB0662_bin_43]|uniref:Single-stranded DNA-binding protein n=1 Tax=Candidatus Spechtbacteria bacterium SB0662_bin_43 TaxID=2604897 RepID=A0A845DJJ9_9BACT|nr:single-stranded DNA-binding protein [Candidatus Spechtbacteria bacterium SB0662_bin_43]